MTVGQLLPPKKGETDVHKTKFLLPLVTGLTTLLASLACSAIPFLAPTATPTATNTPRPTHTPTPRPTRTPIPSRTPSPTVSSLPPTTKEELGDGSTLFTDNEIGYRLAVPPGWFVLELGAGDIQSMMDAGIEANPELEPFLELGSPLLVEGMRFFAFMMSPESLAAGTPTSLFVVAMDSSLTMGIPIDLLTETTAAALDESVAGTRVLAHSFVEEASKIPHGLIEYTQQINSVTGEEVNAHQLMGLIQAEEHVILLILSAEASGFADARPIFEDVIGSLELLH